jgi:predicted nucleotidyltransferase
MTGPLEVLLDFTRVLDELGIKYVVVGSFASSARGFQRATRDVDILARIGLDDVDSLYQRLATRYYIDRLSIRSAVINRSHFNAIHLDSMFKVDVFVPSDSDRLSQQQLSRQLPEKLTPDSDAIVYVATAEDTLLAKLIWYRKGHEVSDRQWADVLGIIRLQGERLERAYLEDWAEKLGIRELLNRALDEAK